MKKIFTLCFGLIAALTAAAQTTDAVQFADKDGNIIADGTVIQLTAYEEDDFGGIIMRSGLYAKNTTAEELQVSGRYIIRSIGSGLFQTCFPKNCITKTARGTYETTSGALAAGELKDMQTEWLPAAEGTCEVLYQLQVMSQNPITGEWQVEDEGPAVTLIFNFDPASVAAPISGATVAARYTLDGMQIKSPRKGLNIIRMADGRVVKRFVK